MSRWPSTTPTVPSLAQLTELENLLAWASFEAPPLAVLGDADPRLIEAFHHNRITDLSILYPLYAELQDTFDATHIITQRWYNHTRSRYKQALLALGRWRAAQIVPIYEAWAAKEPDMAALLAAHAHRQPTPRRIKQCVIAFLGEGLTVAEIARRYGLTKTRIAQALNRAGVHADLRQLHRMNLEWARRNDAQAAPRDHAAAEPDVGRADAAAAAPEPPPVDRASV